MSAITQKPQSFLRAIFAIASIGLSLGAHAAPVASNDDLTTTNPVSQTATLVIPAATLLANDTGTGIGIKSVTTPSTKGALVSWNSDTGEVTYDPRAVAAFIALGQGESTTDTFTYEIEDASNDTDTAVVTIRINGVNDPPVIGGVVSDDLPINDKNTGVKPYPDVTITDLDTNDTLTVTITIVPPGNGSLKNTTGVTNNGGGSYTVAGTTRTQLRDRLRNVEFVPTENIVVPSSTPYDTTLTLALSDGIASTEFIRTVKITSVNDAPTIAGLGNVTMGDNQSLAIFSAVTIADVDVGQNARVTVTFNSLKGSFANPGGNLFSLSGPDTAKVLTLNTKSFALAQADLNSLSFTPTPNQVRVGQHENLTFAIAVGDGPPATAGTLSASGNLTLRVNSINDPPELSPSEDRNFTISAGGTITPYGNITLSDPDVDATVDDGGDLDDNTNLPSVGDSFTATIVLQASPFGTIVSSFFSEVSGSPGTYRYVANRQQVQNAIRGAQYLAPPDVGDFTATLTVRDSSNADSNSILAKIKVMQPAPGMTGLVVNGQTVNDNATINPFNTASFNNFGGGNRYIEVSLDDDAKGAFENLGLFTKAEVEGRYTYYMVGNSTDATNAIRGLRFRPTANRIVGEEELVIFFIKVKSVPNPFVVLEPSSDDFLSSDQVNVMVFPFNDAPTIVGASEDIFINDTQDAKPFKDITVADLDEGGNQSLELTITLLGEDPISKAPVAGGGTLVDPTGTGFADGETIGTYPNITYRFTGVPSAITARLRTLDFVPERYRNAIGQRETVRFTITANDDKTGTAQYTQARVTVTTVSGAPEINGIPDLASQPFAVPTSASNQVKPFDVLTSFSVKDNNASIDFTITLDNPAKGTFSADPALFSSSEAGVYTMTASPLAITNAMKNLVYTIDPAFPFPAAQPGLTTFTLEATDGTNTTTKVYTIFIRNRSVAHIVTSPANDGPGSLREAVEFANSGDTIVFEFADEDYPAIITLDEAIEISKSLQIVGSGVSQLAISGGGQTGIFVVENAATLNLEQLTLRDGAAPSYGGAVAVGEGSGLVARYCEFNGNSAGQYGGAIDVFDGSLVIENCLFVNNFVDGSTAEAGGAISLFTDLPSSITNSTFVNNRQLNPGGLGGGAVYVENADLSIIYNFPIRHCTFKDNHDEAMRASAVLSNSAGARVHLINNILADTQGRVIDVLGGGRFVSAGGNIATDATTTTYTQGAQNVTLLDHVSDRRSTNPMIGPLTFNYGATRTCAPLAGSPAIDNALAITPESSAPGTDQRGFWRPTGTGTKRDIGAHEVGAFRRVNINEIFVHGTPGNNFIEFYNPRDSELLDLLNIRLWIDGVLVDPFETQSLIPGTGLTPGSGFAWFITADSEPEDDDSEPENVGLNSEKGRIELRNSLGQLLNRVDYVASFSVSGELLATSNQSINRYPRYEGGFLPHQRVAELVTGSDAPNPSSPGDDVDGSPLGGGNAPPLAFPAPENLPAYTVYANEILTPNVLANDIDFDRTDTLKITEIMPVVSGQVVNAELLGIKPASNGLIDLTGLPEGLVTITENGATVTIHPDGRGITYDPTTSPVMIALAEGETRTDVWGYTIQDYYANPSPPPADPDEPYQPMLPHPRSNPFDADKSEANIRKATTWFTVTVIGVNEPPTPAPDFAATAENHPLRLLGDATLIGSPGYNFGDQAVNFQEFDSNGNPVTLLPLHPTVALLDNDSDVDNDDDKLSLILGAVHKTAVPTDLLETTSVLGARVVLDIRANRSETNILYDPRASAFLNSLREGEVAEDSFHYSVFDRHGARGVAKVTITVTGVNDVPMARDDDGFHVYEDMALSIPHPVLLANDTDADTKEDGPSDVLSIVSVSPTSALGASVTLSGGTVVFNPTGVEVFVRLARNEFITDTFEYTISDENGGITTATVTVVVEGVNQAPVALNDFLPVLENETAVVSAQNGLISNDVDMDINGGTPDDDPWIIPQRDVITPLGASLTIHPDGSFSYDANSAAIDSLIQGEAVTEIFPYTIVDNFRTTASDDSYKIFTNSTEVVLPVLLNDVVVGATPVPVAGYSAGDGGKLVIESPNHSLRDGLLIRIQGYQGAGSYNGVHAITSIGRDRFIIDVPFVDDPDATRGTWIPWLRIASVSETDKGGVVEIINGQSLLYTPTVGFYGRETFQYAIEDGVGGQDVATVAIDVISAGFNGFVSASDDRFLVGMDTGPVVVDVLVNDGILPGGPTGLAITAVEPLSGATGQLQIVNGGTAVAYTPAGSFAGVESFAYTVSGSGPASATATVVFEVVNRAGKINAADNDFAVVSGSANNLLDVVANDAVLPLYPVNPQVIAINGAAGPVTTGLTGVVSIVGNQISYTPPAGSGFTDTFNYTVKDATGATVTRDVNVRVVAASADFHAVDNHFIVAAGSGPVALPVLANDIVVDSPGATLTVTGLGIGANAPPEPQRVSIVNGQFIQFTPPATAAVESFTYEIGDGTTQRRSARITITVVNAFATLPEAQPDQYKVARNSGPHTLNVLENDIPYPDSGWNWTISAKGNPSHGGTVNIISGGGALSYTPAADFIGMETFEYTITDSIGNTSNATVSVRVGSLFTAPDHFAVLENSAAVMMPVLANDSFLSLGSLDYTISGVTAASLEGGSVVLVGAGPANAVAYTPPADFSGVDTFTYTVIDASGGTYHELVTVEVVATHADRDTAFLTIQITGVNDIPVITGLANAAITDKETINPFADITITDLDAGGNQLQTATFSFDTALGTVDAPGMTLVTAGSYSVTGTPAEVTAVLRAVVFDPFENLAIYIDPGQSLVVFSLVVSDGFVDPALNESVTITVTGVNDPPDPQDDVAYTFENQAIRLLADPDYLAPFAFNFGDNPGNFLDFDGGTELVALLPPPPTVSLLANDIDVDADDDSTTLLLGAIHTTEVPTNLLETTSLLGARVVLDIRADRRETNILYDPRGSAILNALPEGVTIEDSFHYSVFDRHGARGIAKVTIVVTGVNDLPMATDDDGFAVSEDLSLPIHASRLIANDTDPDDGEGGGDGEMLLITSVSTTSQLGAIVTLDVGTQTITFDPTTIAVFQALARNESITDTFTYTTTDASGGTSTATVTVVVTGVNDAPVAENDLLEILENDTAIVSAELGLMSNDVDVDINGTDPDDDPWIIPQREVISPLGAALTIHPDGSYSYDANSAAIDSLVEGELAVEIFPYTMIDNFRTTASDDAFRVFASSEGVELPVLLNDVVVGTTPVAIESYEDDGSGKLVIESANHSLRDGLLIRLQGYSGDGEYNGVHAITSIGRDRFTIDVPFVDDPEGGRGTWIPWLEITSVSPADKGGVVMIHDGQGLSYTPTPGFYGIETFTYSVRDGVGGQDVATVEIEVILPEFNGFVSASDDHFQIGMGSDAHTVDVLANDGIRPGTGQYLTITDVEPVAGAAGTLVIVDGGKALSYTPPDAMFAGMESFTYSVAGSGPDSTTATVTFEVVDRTGRLDGAENDFFVVLGSEDNLLDVLANDPVIPAYPVQSQIVAIGGSPSGTASIVGGQISYTPAATAGIDSFTYTARDASGATVTRAVRVRVVPDQQDFFAIDDHYIILAGTDSLTLPVLSNDGIVNQPGAAIGIVNLGLDSNAPADPERVQIANDGLGIRYTPPATAGTETFTYETGLGQELDTRRRQATVTITVVDRFATAPEAAPDAFHVAKNSGPHVFDVLANDIPLPDSGWRWEISEVTAAPDQGGEALVLGGTTIAYTPAPGFFGVESFEYEITDEFGRTDTATVTIRVGVMWTTPDHFAVLQDTPAVVMPVLVNDDLLENEASSYSISAVSSPSAEGGVVAIVGSGPDNAVSYTPAAGFTGEDSFTYTVIDQTGATLVETVTVRVIPANADRDQAVLRVEITGVNDVPVIVGTADRAITDKESVNPFENIAITDLDEWGDQQQQVTVTYNVSTGTVSAPGMTLIAPGTYRRTGTPAEVSAALRAMVFTPFENIIDYIDPGQADVAFNLSLTDFYVPAPLQLTTIVTVTPVNDAPTIITPIPDKVLHVNSLPTVVNLWLHFADVDDNIDGGQLVWSATSTNPGLFSEIVTEQDNNRLILKYATDQFGVAQITVRGTDRGGLFVETTFTVTVEGPPVIVLRPGETVLPPAVLVPLDIVNNKRLFRDSFRVANQGTLPVTAFIVHVSGLNSPINGTVLESASYSTNENGTPDTYGDDTRSSVGVTIQLMSSGVYQVKYDRPIAPGESLVVHLFYRVPNMDDTLVIRPTIRISLTTANPDSSPGLESFSMEGAEGTTISFNLEANKVYQFQYSSDLVVWHNWLDPIPASPFPRVVEFIDDGSVTGTHPSDAPSRFYRMAELP